MIDDRGVIRCPDCRSVLPHGHDCKFPGLRAALEMRGVKITETDEKMLRWMAQWDRPTCDWFVSVVTRSGTTGVGYRLGELLAEERAHRLEVVADNPDLVHNELVAAGAVVDTPCKAHEVTCSDKTTLRWRQGSVRVGSTPILVKSAMAPVGVRDPVLDVDLGDIGDEWPALVDQGGEPGGAR